MNPSMSDIYAEQYAAACKLFARRNVTSTTDALNLAEDTLRHAAGVHVPPDERARHAAHVLRTLAFRDALRDRLVRLITKEERARGGDAAALR